jgi:hypothetical protein
MTLVPYYNESAIPIFDCPQQNPGNFLGGLQESRRELQKRWIFKGQVYEMWLCMVM